MTYSVKEPILQNCEGSFNLQFSLYYCWFYYTKTLHENQSRYHFMRTESGLDEAMFPISAKSAKPSSEPSEVAA